MKKYRSLLILLFSLSATVAAAADLKDVFEDAQRHFRRGDYEGAVEAWTRVIDAQPSDTNAGSDQIDLSLVYFNRGFSYKRLHLWKEAADDFSMVLGFDPNDARALYERGGCYNMLGLDDKAAADIAKACRLDDAYCDEKMLEEKREQKEKESLY